MIWRNIGKQNHKKECEKRRVSREICVSCVRAGNPKSKSIGRTAGALDHRRFTSANYKKLRQAGKEKEWKKKSNGPRRAVREERRW